MAIAYETPEEAYKRGVAEERKRIVDQIRKEGYDWSHDKKFSGLQNLLNWIEETPAHELPMRTLGGALGY
jgi:hypothetical protein